MAELYRGTKKICDIRVNRVISNTGNFINGTTANYTAGETISRGDFVKLGTDTKIMKASGTDIILGVAITSANTDGQITIVKP